MNMGRQLLDVPFDEMIFHMASAVADAQSELDRKSIELMKMMSDSEVFPVSLPVLGASDGQTTETERKTSMIDAGFQPTFYQFTETIIEVRMAVSVMRNTSEYGTPAGTKRSILGMTATPIDASYTNKFGYSQEGSSFIRTKLVPVPPNPIILDMIAHAGETHHR